jgi:sialidase-1
LFHIGGEAIGIRPLFPNPSLVAPACLKPLLFLASSLLVTAVSHAAPVEHVDAFTANSDGYHTYGILAVLRVRDGTLLAFAEGRKSGRGDAGDIDMLVNRSRDGGRTGATSP